MSALHLTDEQVNGIVSAFLKAIDWSRGGFRISLGVTNTPATVWYGGPDGSSTGDGQRLAFTAPPGQETLYVFSIPFDCYLSGGYYNPSTAGPDDVISFGVATGVDESGQPVWHWYVRNVPVTPGFPIEVFDPYSTSAKIPAGTPMVARYKNTGTSEILVRFWLVLHSA